MDNHKIISRLTGICRKQGLVVQDNDCPVVSKEQTLNFESLSGNCGIWSDSFFSQGECVQWDDAAQKLTLRTDPYGLSRLYTRQTADGICFGFHPVDVHGTGSVDLHSNVLEYTLSNREQRDRCSVINRVEMLHSGEGLIFDCQSGKILRDNHHRLSKVVHEEAWRKNQSQDMNQLSVQLERFLFSHIKNTLQSAKKIGLLSGGGIDASLVGAIAAAEGVSVPVLCSSYAMNAYSDKEAAQRYCDATGVELVSVTIDYPLFARTLVQLIHDFQRPILHPNIVGNACISKKASEEGFDVLFNGAGSDLFMGGLDKYRSFIKYSRVEGLAKFLPKPLRGENPYLGKSAEELFDQFSLISQSLPVEGIVKEDVAYQDLKKEVFEAYSFIEASSSRWLHALMLYDVLEYMEPLMNSRQLISSANRVAFDLPYLDDELTQWALNVPTEKKVNWSSTKLPIRSLAQKYLPKDIVHSNKWGSPAPIREWLPSFECLFPDGYLRQIPEFNTCLSGFKRDNNIAGIWRLIDLEIWARLFIRKEPVDHVVQKVLENADVT